MRSELCARFAIGQAQVNLSRQSPVRVQFVTVDEDVGPHDHDYYEICLARAGRAVHRTRRGRSDFEAGSVAVLGLGEVHAFEKVRGLEVINVYYLTEWLLGELRLLWDQDGLVPLFLAHDLFAGRVGGSPQWNLCASEQILCACEAAAIVEETRAGDSCVHAPSWVYLKSAVLKLLVVLGRAYARGTQREMGFRFRREVRLALDYLEEAAGTAGTFSLLELGRRVGVSGGHAARLFKSATGRSAQEYFQRRRAQQAALRLLDPGRSITEVAFEAGYSDAAHFSRLFRRYLGLSPREYRCRYGAS